MWSTLKGTLGTMRPHKRLRCSFCGRKAEDVERLVAGAKAYICDACIAECVAVLQDNGGFGTPRPDRVH
jgi:ClpX C4-type zinc finger